MSSGHCLLVAHNSWRLKAVAAPSGMFFLVGSCGTVQAALAAEVCGRLFCLGGVAVFFNQSQALHIFCSLLLHLHLYVAECAGSWAQWGKIEQFSGLCFHSHINSNPSL